VPTIICRAFAQCGQRRGERALVAGVEAAQVEQQRAVLDAADHRAQRMRASAAQARLDAVEHAALPALRADGEAGRGQAVHRQRAGADLRFQRDDLHRYRQRGQRLCNLPAAGVRRRRGFGFGPRQLAHGGDALVQAIRIAVEREHGFQRGQRQLADAQRALQRVLLDLRDQVACGRPAGRPAARPAACRRRR
jgi:hypothetical protein